MARLTALRCIGVALVSLPGAAGADGGTMSAVRIHAFGGAEVLQVESVPLPSPAADELLVRVHAAGVNPIDTLVRGGHAQDLAGAVLPYVPGYDLSGVVAEVGADVTRFAAGDEVFAMTDLRRGGAYAGYAIVKDGEASLKPASVSHAEAASLPLVALTAWQALFDTADLQPDETVLIHAGAGGVGSMAIQLAKWRGARVITTASAANHEFMRALGADLAIDYHSQRFEDVVAGVHVVLDPIGGSTQVRSLDTLRDGGRLVSLVGLGQAARLPVRGINASDFLVRPDAEQLRQIAVLVDAGALQPIVSHRFPLSGAADAHRQSETRRTRGKIVLEVVEASDDLDGVRAAALDYIEGWYEGNAERMARSLHPELVKRLVVTSGGDSVLEQMTADALIADTGQGGGRNTPPERQRTDVTVLDVFRDVASVRVDADGWIDYMHMAKWDGEWKIINVLWALRR